MPEPAAERGFSSASAATRGQAWQYVARADCEATLARLVTALRGGATRVALVGPPASGKTLLLHVLAERLGPGFASAYLPNPALGPAQVRAWLETLGEPLPADAGASLEDLALAHARRGPGMVLLIDDGEAMPDAVADAFGETLAHTDDRLRIVVAGADAGKIDQVLGHLGGQAEHVTLGGPALPRETRVPVGPAVLPPPVAYKAVAAPAPAPPRRRPRPRTASLAIAGSVLLALAATIALDRDAATRRSPVGAAPSADAPAAPPPASARSTVAPVAAGPPVLVNLNASPWARVEVDGRALGVTPLGNVPIEPGLRRFRAELADGRVIEREVRIDGANRRVIFP